MEALTQETEPQTSEERLEYWREHFVKWKQSKESQADFCKRRNLSYAKFCYWRYHVKRSMKKTKSAQPENKLVPVTIKATESSGADEKAAMSIRLPNGVCISVPAGVDKSQHKLVMQLLGAKS